MHVCVLFLAINKCMYIHAYINMFAYAYNVYIVEHAAKHGNRHCFTQLGVNHMF